MRKKRNAETHADNVRGDKISVGNINTSTGVAIGRGAQATVTQTSGASAEEIAKIFATLTAKVNTLPDGPDKSVAASAVQAFRDEAQKGDTASESNVSKGFDFLAQSAPDAFEVAVATFANPIAELGMAFKKITDRAKQER